MFRILEEASSSGTTQSAGLLTLPFQGELAEVLAEEIGVGVGVWNTAEVTFVPLSPAGRSPRPLSALSELAVDLGPADLSETFRTRR